MTTDELMNWYEGKPGYLYHLTDGKLIIYYGTLRRSNYSSRQTDIMKFRTVTFSGETEYVVPIEQGLVYRNTVWFDTRDDDAAIEAFVARGNAEVQNMQLKIKKIEKRNRELTRKRTIKEGSYGL